MDAGLHRFVDADELEFLLARIEFASQHSAIRAISEDDVRVILARFSEGLRSFTELAATSREALIPALKELAGGERLSERGGAGTPATEEQASESQLCPWSTAMDCFSTSGFLRSE